MRNKQVEFNPYIYTLTTLSKLYPLATKYPFFNTKHPVIILRASVFAVTPSHVASSKIECQNFSYVYRSREHWECKYVLVCTFNLWDSRPIVWTGSNCLLKMQVINNRPSKYVTPPSCHTLHALHVITSLSFCITAFIMCLITCIST